jgi:hypothetical protein
VRCISAWKNLSDSDRATWVAAAPDFPFTNKFGNSYTPSAYQLFVSVNQNLQAIQEAIITVAPSVPSLDVSPAFVIEPVGATPNSFQIDVIIPSEYIAILSCTSSQSPGRNYNSSKIKAISLLDEGTFTNENISPAFVAVFGSIPLSGYNWWQLKMIHIPSGRASLPYVISYTWS